MNASDTFIKVHIVTPERPPKVYEKYVRVDQIFGVIAPSEEMIERGSACGIETFQGMFIVTETIDEVIQLLSKVYVERI